MFANIIFGACLLKHLTTCYVVALYWLRQTFFLTINTLDNSDKLPRDRIVLFHAYYKNALKTNDYTIENRGNICRVQKLPTLYFWTFFYINLIFNKLALGICAQT